jgi:uncharacterized membrane protein YkoI
MKLNAVALAACLVLYGLDRVSAAEVKVKPTDLPPAVQNAVKEQSKGARLRSLTKETENGKTEYEAELTVNDHNRDVSFDSSGNVISVEDEVPLSSLPGPARAAILKALGSGTLKKVELLNEHGKTFYEASIRKGGKSSEIQVDPSGAQIK